jgi:hypothetical protein
VRVSPKSGGALASHPPFGEATFVSQVLRIGNAENIVRDETPLQLAQALFGLPDGQTLHEAFHEVPTAAPARPRLHCRVRPARHRAPFHYFARQADHIALPFGEATSVSQVLRIGNEQDIDCETILLFHTISATPAARPPCSSPGQGHVGAVL